VNKVRLSRSLRRPTKHYDQNVFPIDEQLCALVAKRKAVSNGNPGFPRIEQIEAWATQYGLYPSYLHSIFHALYNEQLHRPRVEPSGFRGIVPVMKLAEKESQVFLITHIRQYQNASVLYFQIDSKLENKCMEGRRPHIPHWELSVGPGYECYSSNGSGNNEQWIQQFVISPPLPDDLKDISFKFTWRSMPPDEESEVICGEVVLL
jgi:AraC-like DNA-binding protein